MSEIDRFIQAQEDDYDSALKEIKNGKKKHVGCGIYFPKFKV